MFQFNKNYIFTYASWFYNAFTYASWIYKFYNWNMMSLFSKIVPKCLSA